MHDRDILLDCFKINMPAKSIIKVVSKNNIDQSKRHKYKAVTYGSIKGYKSMGIEEYIISWPIGQQKGHTAMKTLW